MSDTQRVLAWAFAGSFIGLLVLWTFFPPPGNPEQVAGMINTLIGILAASATAVVAYYFGSSTGSKDKDKTLADIAKGNGHTPEPQPPDGGGEGDPRE